MPKIVRGIVPNTAWPRYLQKTITFTSGGTGASGTNTNLFTVTGEVLIEYTTAFCTTSLEQSGATPTLQYGVDALVELFIAATTATTIDANELWIGTSPGAGSAAIPAAMKDIHIGNGDSISCTVAGTANISAGVIEFNVWWRPMSANGLVVSA